MDDIDRTYWKLKRCDFNTMHRKLYTANKTINDFLWIKGDNDLYACINESYHHICIENGWTAEEFTKEFYKDIK
jgi:hypothetical protein